MKKINPFCKAKKHLWNGQYPRCDNPGKRHICDALEDANISATLHGELCDYINWLLLGEATVYSWLIQYAGVKFNIFRDESLNVQAYRSRWLDHLAKEWDKDGGFPEHYLRAKELDSSEADSQISH